MDLPPHSFDLSSRHPTDAASSISRSSTQYQPQRLQHPQQHPQSLHHSVLKQRRPISYQSTFSSSDAGTRIVQPPPDALGSNLKSSLQPKQSLRQQQLLNGRFTEEWDASRRGSSILDDHRGRSAALGSVTGDAAMEMQHSSSVANSFINGDDQQEQEQQQTAPPQRGNTLKKKSSMRRAASLGRSSSRRGAKAGSVRSLALHTGSDPDMTHSPFFCPVPTSGSPTDVLVSRFQTWRKILKDLIAYYREIQNQYEQRAKSLIKLANVANNISTPPSFLTTAGIDDALQILRNYNKTAIQEANKAKDIEQDVILALTGLRSDLQQKIKEIKHLSGDFKTNVEKEMEGTSKAVKQLSEVLEKNDVDASTTTGKQDPYLLRLAVDRQIERQLDEENYLHQAYLNLEGSGRELESIIVGEIQKAYNAYTGILKREADNAYAAVGELRDGPISMPKDQEWIHFVTNDNRVVDPSIPLRSAERIQYPGQDHVATQEIRVGLLERKSKYLKSYTGGWYVLSTTHLHEFKSADKIQAPVMSLYLPDQKLGSRSSEGGSSNKFVLKGRQTGSMHRGHTWVFRAESHDSMMAWYDDIKALTEKSPEERSHFVRSHSQRSLNRATSRLSASTDGLDEEDEEPFTANEGDIKPAPRPELARRSQPGGRFPSDIQVNAQRGLQVPQSPSLSSSQELHSDAQVIAAAAALPGAAPAALTNGHHEESDDYPNNYGSNGEVPMDNIPSQAALANHQAQYDGVNPYTSEPLEHPVENHSSPHHENLYVTPVVALRDYEARDGSGIDGDAVFQQDLEQERPYHDGIYDTLASRGVDAHETNGAHYMNGANMMNGNHSGVVADDMHNVPRSSVAKDIEGLQVVTNMDHAVPVSAVETPVEMKASRPVRPADHRTESMTTISSLHVPGGFPKSAISSP